MTYRSTERHDFARLKRVVTIDAVLARYGLDQGLSTDRRGELVGPCPLPRHAGDRSHRGAFRVNRERGLWRCVTHCGGGDLVQLVAVLEHGDYAVAARVLAELEGGAAPSGVPQGLRPPFGPYTQTLRLRPHHPFLTHRRITPETAGHFEAGWWPLGGFLRGCVAVRLHDTDGAPIGYAGRRIDPAESERFGKWKLPSGLPKADVLFNWHRAQRYRRLFVVEGPWDVMRLHQAGFPNAVALLGLSVSPTQHQLLTSSQRVTLALDGDDPGRRASDRIAADLLSYGVSVDRVDLPDGTDPADAADPVLDELLKAGHACLPSRPRQDPESHKP